MMNIEAVIISWRYACTWDTFCKKQIIGWYNATCWPTTGLIWDRTILSQYDYVVFKVLSLLTNMVV